MPSFSICWFVFAYKIVLFGLTGMGRDSQKMVDSSGLLVIHVSTSALVRVLIKQYQIVSFVDELGSLIDLCRHSQHTMASYLS